MVRTAGRSPTPFPASLDSAAAREKIEVLPVAPLLAEIIRRLHAGHALVDLLVL